MVKKVPSMQVGGTEAALFDYARGGPQWGADALVIGPPQVSVLLCCIFPPGTVMTRASMSATYN